MRKISISFIVLITTAIQVCSQPCPATEIRAVWLTTNYNLDWPKNKLSVDAQKNELVQLLDELKNLNFNMVLFQTRTNGEVLYRSQIEPMYRSIAKNYGGEAFDPLAFVVKECHKRGMECHAWLITYPLGSRNHVKNLGNASVVKKHPQLVTFYKNQWYLDPGNPKTDDYLLSIVKEIVTNYDVDGIHFDYIRYPANCTNFFDQSEYNRYGKSEPRDNWRRSNINRFVGKVYDRVKSIKPWVMISSSPVGRYRPLLHNPNDGWTAYNNVYQDPIQWLNEGKHDAIFPMMYYRNKLFYPYLNDWVENSKGRFVVPGLGIYQIQELGWQHKDIIDQMEYTRKKSASGNAFFRTEHLLNYNRDLFHEINNVYYRYPAKLPPMTWLSDTLPDPPHDLRAEKTANEFQLRWKVKNPAARITYNVYRTKTDNPDFNDGSTLLATGLRQPVFTYCPPEDDQAYYYFITVSDSFHNESKPCVPAFFWHSETVK